MSGQAGIGLRVNQMINLGCENPMAPSDGITVNLNSREVPRLVKPNDVLYLDDGKIILLVQDCEMVSHYRKRLLSRTGSSARSRQQAPSAATGASSFPQGSRSICQY